MATCMHVHTRRARLHVCMYRVSNAQLYDSSYSTKFSTPCTAAPRYRSSTKFSIPGYSSRILVRSCSEHIRMYIILQRVSDRKVSVRQRASPYINVARAYMLSYRPINILVDSTDRIFDESRPAQAKSPCHSLVVPYTL